MSWTNEFTPDYDVPAYFAENFNDGSWHNDACPSFYHKLLPIMVWVDHPDANQREIGPNMKRFAVCGIDQGPCLLETDDLNAIQEFFAPLRGLSLPSPTTDTSKRHSEVWYAREMLLPTGENNFRGMQGESHILVALTEEMDLDAIFRGMQGERWSPEGQARGYIRGLGVHTSMSVGDVVVQYGELADPALLPNQRRLGAHVCTWTGWKEVEV
jgi:hypothetical protein